MQFKSITKTIDIVLVTGQKKNSNEHNANQHFWQMEISFRIIENNSFDSLEIQPKFVCMFEMCVYLCVYVLAEDSYCGCARVQIKLTAFDLDASSAYKLNGRMILINLE